MQLFRQLPFRVVLLGMDKAQAGSSDLAPEFSRLESVKSTAPLTRQESSNLDNLREELEALRSADRQWQRTHFWLLIAILLASLVGAGFGIGAFVVSTRGNAESCSQSPGLPRRCHRHHWREVLSITLLYSFHQSIQQSQSLIKWARAYPGI